MTALEFGYQIAQSSKSLKPFAVRLTRDVEDANDLLQETLLKAYIHREKFTDGTNIKAWLYTIMKNTFITNYQRMVRQKTFVDTTENLHYLNSPSYVTQNMAEGSFVMQDIQKAIGHLDESHRRPFVMYYTGYKYQEISETLRLPIGTVKNRIHLARKELKDILVTYKR
jgi:RNA polymerase sigma-70 factor (ECF subfamily)